MAKAIHQQKRHLKKVLKAAKTHTLLVRVLRIFLPICTLATFGLYFVSTGVTVSVGPGEASVKNIALSGTDIRMERPSYTGFDERNGQYTVSADYALQNIKEPHIFNLFKINAQSNTSPEEWVQMRANEGTFHAKQEWLKLINGINIKTQNGMNAHLQTAHVDMKTRQIVSQQPVRVEMPTGTMRADQMQIDTGKQQLTFVDNVYVHLNNANAAQQSTNASAETGQTEGLSNVLQNSSNAPIDISSQTLEVFHKDQKAIFKGEIVATQGDMNLQSGELQVHYKNTDNNNVDTDNATATETSQNQAQRIAQIKALDNVIIKTNDGREATANATLFNNEKQIVTLDNNVRLSQNKNVITADRLIINLQNRHSKFPAGRTLVKGQFHPPQNTEGRAQQTVTQTAPGQNNNLQAFAGLRSDSNSPIFIEARSLDIFEQRQKAIFQGDVNVKRGDNFIKSQIMELEYASGGPLGAAQANGQGGQLKQIFAKNNVFISTPDNQAISGDEARFYLLKDTAIIRGNVVLTQGENVLKGDRLDIDLKTGEFQLKNDTPNIADQNFDTENKPKERVRLLFTPGTINQGSSQNTPSRTRP